MGALAQERGAAPVSERAWLARQVRCARTETRYNMPCTLHKVRPIRARPARLHLSRRAKAQIGRVELVLCGQDLHPSTTSRRSVGSSVILVPGLVACCDARLPVRSILRGGVRTHAVTSLALVEHFDLVVLEAVVPLASCVSERRCMFVHNPQATASCSSPLITRNGTCAASRSCLAGTQGPGGPSRTAATVRAMTPSREALPRLP